MIPGESAVTEKLISYTNGWTSQSGTGYPRILLVEMCAQTSGLAAGRTDENAGTGYLCAIPEFRIFCTPQCGDILTIEARIEATLGTLVSASCRVSCDRREYASGRLSLSLPAQ